MKNIFFLIFASLTVLGCSKSETPVQATITMQSLSGNYKVTAATVNGLDILSTYLTPCQADDIYTLNADATYFIADAGTACTPSSAASGAWTLTGNLITIGAQQFTLLTFDGNKIQASTSVTQGTTTVTVIVDFTKQ